MPRNPTMIPIGCIAPMTRTFKLEFDSACWRCIHRGDIAACQSYRIENNLEIVYRGRDHVVSQANYFRDAVSGALYDTPAEPIKSEAASRRRKASLAEIHRINR